MVADTPLLLYPEYVAESVTNVGYTNAPRAKRMGGVCLSTSVNVFIAHHVESNIVRRVLPIRPIYTRWVMLQLSAPYLGQQHVRRHVFLTLHRLITFEQITDLG